MGTPLEVALEIILAVLIALACAGMGAMVLRGDEEFSFLLALPLGMGALAYLVFALALAGWLEKPFLMGLVALGLVALIVNRWRKGAPSLLPSLRSLASLVRRHPHLAFPLLFLVIVVFLNALAPPTDWDGLSYHLAVPKRYLMAGRMHYIPDIHHSNFPATLEMLYLLALGLGGLSAPKLLHFLAFVWCLLLAFVWTRELSQSEEAGLLSALVLASAPVALWEACSAYIDLGLALFETCALFCAYRLWRQKELRYALLCGAFAGFAGGTKITGLLCGLLLALAVPFLSPKGRRLRALLLFALPALLIACPWYVRSLVWTGNPVFPFAYRIFGGRNWDMACAEAYRQSLRSYGMGRSLPALLLLPWNAVFHAEAFGNGPFVILSLGPMFLALLPAWLFVAVKPSPSPVRILCVASLAYVFVRILVWFELSQQNRFLMPLLPLASVACALSAHEILRPRPARLTVHALLIAVTLAHAGLFGLSALPALQIRDRTEYLSQTLDVYPAQHLINRWLPPSAKILLLGETRGFYLDRPYMWGDEGHHTLLPYSRMSSPEELRRRLKSLGITHLLVNLAVDSGFFEGRDRMSQLFLELMERGELVYSFERGHIVVLEVKG